MGLITKRLILHGPRRKRSVEALFDTGSSKSFIRGDIAQGLGQNVELPEPRKFEMARGTLAVREGLVADVAIGRHRLFHTFLVVDGLTEEVIIGADFLQEWHIRLEPRSRRIILDPRALRLKAVGARFRP